MARSTIRARGRQLAGTGAAIALSCLTTTTSAAQTPGPLDTQPTLLILAPGELLSELEPALSIELAGAGVAVEGEPMSGTPEPADALLAARASGAVAVAWRDADEQGQPRVRVLDPARPALVSAPLADPESPRLFATIAASLLDELRTPPEALARTRPVPAAAAAPIAAARASLPSAEELGDALPPPARGEPTVLAPDPEWSRYALRFSVLVEATPRTRQELFELGFGNVFAVGFRAAFAVQLHPLVTTEVSGSFERAFDAGPAGGMSAALLVHSRHRFRVYAGAELGFVVASDDLGGGNRRFAALRTSFPLGFGWRRRLGVGLSVGPTLTWPEEQQLRLGVTGTLDVEVPL